MIQNYSNRKGGAPAIVLGALALIGATVAGYVNKDKISAYMASKPAQSYSIENEVGKSNKIRDFYLGSNGVVILGTGDRAKIERNTDALDGTANVSKAYDVHMNGVFIGGNAIESQITANKKEDSKDLEGKLSGISEQLEELTEDVQSGFEDIQEEYSAQQKMYVALIKKELSKYNPQRVTKDQIKRVCALLHKNGVSLPKGKGLCFGELVKLVGVKVEE